MLMITVSWWMIIVMGILILLAFALRGVVAMIGMDATYNKRRRRYWNEKYHTSKPGSPVGRMWKQ